MLDDGGEGDGAAGLDVVGDVAELGVGLLGDLLDVDVEDAAAGEADRKGVVVADAVALQLGSPAGDDLVGRLVDRALDAPA